MKQIKALLWAFVIFCLLTAIILGIAYILTGTIDGREWGYQGGLYFTMGEIISLFLSAAIYQENSR